MSAQDSAEVPRSVAPPFVWLPRRETLAHHALGAPITGEK
jgi:hypothetical protein